MTIQDLKTRIDVETMLTSAKISFALDYIRVQGPARLVLRQQAGNDMRDLGPAMPKAPDAGVQIGIASDSASRPHREDSVVAIMAHFGDEQAVTPVILAGVADGVGGSANGHLASAIAIQVLTEVVLNQLAASVVTLNPDLGVLDIERLLAKAINLANFRIIRDASGGSTTLTCALVIDRAAYIAHIGDCRAYLLNTEWQDMELITQDHRRERKWRAFQIASNERFTSHRLGHVLTRALGKNDPCEVDMTRRNLVNGTRLLLCSNGVWESVSPETIFAIVHQSDQTQDICERLVTAAVVNRVQDDATAVLIKMPDSTDGAAETRIELAQEASIMSVMGLNQVAQ